MKFAPILLLLILSFYASVLNGQNRLKKWGQMENTFLDIDFQEKGNNHYQGNVFIEKAVECKLYPICHHYYLSNSNGQNRKLDIASNGSEKILYYNFVDNHLFVIVSHFELNDVVTVLNFDIHSGECLFRFKGQIPCQSKFKYDWSIGNTDCEWIHFNEQKLALVKSKSVFEFQYYIYDWKVNKSKIVNADLDIGLGAIGGLIIDGNVKYDKKNESFKLNDH